MKKTKTLKYVEILLKNWAVIALRVKSVPVTSHSNEPNPVTISVTPVLMDR